MSCAYRLSNDRKITLPLKPIRLILDGSSTPGNERSKLCSLALSLRVDPVSLQYRHHSRLQRGIEIRPRTSVCFQRLRISCPRDAQPTTSKQSLSVFFCFGNPCLMTCF